MAADQSQFSRLPKRQLVFISEKLIDEEFPIGNPYDSDFDHAYNILQEVSRYFSISATHEDVEFFAKFLEQNENIIADLFANNREQIKNTALIDSLEIPVAKEYRLEYTVWGTCSYTEYLSQDFSAYDESWVKDSAQQQRNDGNWDYYDGVTTSPTDYENFEENDSSYDKVYPVPEKIKESLLSKMVIENTEDVVKSLDKETLMKLKSVIDSSLGLL
jgi:hypothetical protein